MPLLKPTIDNETQSIIDPRAVLREAGLLTKSAGKSAMSQILEDEGLGRTECARRITTFAFNATNEDLQYRATELALKLHGELDSKNKDSGNIQINFIGATPDMMNILIPR